MVLPLYNIRENSVDDRHPYKMYRTHFTLFSIKLHHGGFSQNHQTGNTTMGNINFVDMIVSDEFSVHEIVSMLEDLGYDGHMVMFYHFLKPFWVFIKKPCCDLDNGLEALTSDKDVVLLAKYVTKGLKLVEVYFEHEKTNLDIYTPPTPNKLVIEELDDAEPRTSKTGITPVAKKLVLDVNESESNGKDKGETSGKGQSSGKDQEPYVVTFEEGKRSLVGNDGSSQVPSQFVNGFYSSYDPYEDSQDPNFDQFADLNLILPTINNREGNTSQC
ncbi:hypothetical protein Tco_1383504 [Tanacetum coccineum]